MAKKVDLTGQQFGRLTVVARSRQDKRGRWTWMCQCSCGQAKVVASIDLRQGNTKSCGCIHKERMSNLTRVHGLSAHPLYNTWKMMLRRCNDAKNPAFPDYGGRGISVCPAWSDPITGLIRFSEDMGSRPSPKHSIERKDNDLGYSPENCTWATPQEQSANRRYCHLIEHNGRTQTLTAWAREIGISPSSMRERWTRGERGPRLLRPKT